MTADIRRVKDFAGVSGLELNGGKCEMFVLAAGDALRSESLRTIQCLIPNIRLLHSSELELLGAPLNEMSAESVLAKKSSLIDLWCSRLPLLDAHPALFLVRCSLYAPRLVYLLRCFDADAFRCVLQRMDDKLRTCLSSLLNVDLMRDDAWRLASLPISSGGLGVRFTLDLVDSAHLGSLSRFKALASTFSPPDVSAHLVGRVESLTLRFQARWNSIPDEISQATLDGIVILFRRHELSQSVLEVHDRARLNAAFNPSSGCWLHAIPSPALGTMRLHRNDYE